MYLNWKYRKTKKLFCIYNVYNKYKKKYKLCHYSDDEFIKIYTRQRNFVVFYQTEPVKHSFPYGKKMYT